MNDKIIIFCTIVVAIYVIFTEYYIKKQKKVIVMLISKIVYTRMIVSNLIDDENIKKEILSSTNDIKTNIDL